MPVPGMRQPRKHVIQNRKLEIAVALGLIIAATYLLYDAFNWRGKDMPWPFSGLFWG